MNYCQIVKVHLTHFKMLFFNWIKSEFGHWQMDGATITQIASLPHENKDARN